MLKTAAMHTKLGGLRNRGHHHTGCILNSIGSNAGNTLHTRAEGEGLWVFQSSSLPVSWHSTGILGGLEWTHTRSRHDTRCSWALIKWVTADFESDSSWLTCSAFSRAKWLFQMCENVSLITKLTQVSYSL